MLPELVLAAIIYAGIPTTGQRLEWACMAPAVNDSGTCRFPSHMVAASDSVTIHWRIFHLYDWGHFDDSTKVARPDTLVVTYPVTEVRYYIRYVWTSRTGMDNGPKTLYGCARGKLLVPVMP